MRRECIVTVYLQLSACRREIASVVNNQYYRRVSSVYLNAQGILSMCELIINNNSRWGIVLVDEELSS